MSKKQRPRPAVVHPQGAPSYQVEKIPDRWTNEELAKQAYIDLKENELWVNRQSFRDTFTLQMDWWAHNALNDKGRIGMYHIIEVNSGLREKRERDKREKGAEPQAAVAPATAGGDRIVEILVQAAAEIVTLRAEIARLKEPPPATA